MENPESQGGESIPQWDSGAGGTCSATTTVVGLDTSETGGSPHIQRAVSPNDSRLASGTAANGAVTQRKTGTNPKRARPAEVSEECQLDGAWPWSRFFSSKPNVQWFGTQ